MPDRTASGALAAFGRPLEPRIQGRADAAADAGVRELFGRTVMWFAVRGGKHHGALSVDGAAVVERAIGIADRTGIPVVGEVDTSGAELRDNVASLHAWGRLARAVAGVSGRVPTVLIVSGACVSGPALALGLFDAVVMTADAFAYLSGPQAVAEFTGVRLDRFALGGAAVHARESGVATLVAADLDEARVLAATMLDHLPDHHLADPPRLASGDPAARRCAIAAATVPAQATASYDVRVVVRDVVDDGDVLELRPAYAPNLITAFARLAGRPVGIVANQPCQRAGTLDIEASRKAARFVQCCDAFNVPIVTFVDTPGFEPGRDLEWRGMIRHGAELVHAYCAATVPRICVVLRKAYGGAYIVMDSRGIGNDFCCAWPTAEIAVMGAPGAVEILHGKRLAALDASARIDAAGELVREYEQRFANPYVAAERGVVDMVIEPVDTRRVLCDALDLLARKRDRQPSRRHGNTPM